MIEDEAEKEIEESTSNFGGPLLKGQENKEYVAQENKEYVAQKERHVWFQRTITQGKKIFTCLSSNSQLKFARESYLTTSMKKFRRKKVKREPEQEAVIISDGEEV